MSDSTCPPDGEPLIHAIAMPADANPSGDIFGGWLMSQMDLAAANAASRRCRALASKDEVLRKVAQAVGLNVLPRDLIELLRLSFKPLAFRDLIHYEVWLANSCHSGSF